MFQCLSSCFAPSTFYARSLPLLVRWSRVGWKMEGKAHESEQQLERGRKTYGMYATSHEMCDGCLSCHERVAHASCFCWSPEHCSPTWPVTFYMYNATHTLASLVSFPANGLWLCIYSHVICMQGDCCGSWPMVGLFVKRLMRG